MRKGFFYIWLIVLAYACHSGPAGTTAEIKTADSAKTAEEIRSNMSFLNDYNAMEAVFGNENWMLVEDKDTSYFYFSRLGNFKFNTYAYKRIKGDSAQVKYGKIIPEKNNLSWEFDGKQLMVTSATVARIAASENVSDSSVTYEFVRLDNSHIGITYPGRKKAVLVKTIPFGLFLVRSRYDYLHGTKFAFDTAQYTKKN